MNGPPPQPQTIFFIWTFFFIYVFALLKGALKNILDVFDFFLLSMVPLVPCIFVTFPRTTQKLSQLMGVEFPFVVLLGILHLVLFWLVFRLLKRTNTLQKNIVELTQALALQHKEKIADE
jgi:hypothetical protein